MAYIPSLNDLGVQPDTQAMGYTPSLSDIGQSASQDDKAQKMQMLRDVTGADQTPFGNVRDFLYGMGKAGANIAKIFNKDAPAMPDIRQQHPNGIVTAVGQYLPFGIAGGASLLGSTAGAGAFGATQYEPGQHGFIDSMLNKTGVGYQGGAVRNATEDALLNMIFHGLGGPVNKMLGKTSPTDFSGNKLPDTSIPQVNFKNETTFSPKESEFNNVPFQPPSFLQQKQSPALSGNIADEITSGIMGKRNLEQSGKELASHINRTYQNVKDIHSEKFDKIFDSPTGEISFQTDEPILVKDKLITDSAYKNNDFLADTNDKNLHLLDSKYRETTNIENGHKLQSELGSEIGYLKKQRENGLLDAEGKNRLNNYVQAQNAVQQDIGNQLQSISPELRQNYDVAREDWRKNVIPYHTDKDLRQIAEGRIKNPEAGQIVNIFKNPEENINKVTGDLDPLAKDRITHIALGKVKEDLKPEELLNARKSLDLNGMSSYINPEHEQGFRNLRSNLQMEKERQAKVDADQAFVKGLKNIHQQAENERISAAKIREKGQQNAYNESNKIIAGHQKNIQTDYQKGIQQELDRQDANKKFLKKIAVGTTAVALAHELGLGQSEVLAAYLAGLPGKFWNRKNK